MASFHIQSLRIKTPQHHNKAIPRLQQTSSNTMESTKLSTSASTRTPTPCSLQNTSCKATGGRLDRHDTLLGLGRAAAGLVILILSNCMPRGALAAPIQAPDLSMCQPPTNVPNTVLNCCPPYDPKNGIIDFKLPPRHAPLRVRRVAHLVDAEYVAKYERAYELMKRLPIDDPRSFEQQWRVHCAHCDGGYSQVGFPDLEIQVHNSWLFFPWHRFYLYFHERILGKLIGDDTFALPFWNWDAPAGMTLPAIYTNQSSPLYNEKRNPAHQPPLLIDLDYSEVDVNISSSEQIDSNLRIMYRQMISGAKETSLFMGWPYRAGDQPNRGAGSLENQPHGTVHGWTGDPKQPSGEDMGVFYSAARDPVFFAHHANVDRMWHVWRGLRPGNKDFTDPDWLNTTFLFYDENAHLVRVKIRDCLNTNALRYTYQEVPLPWLNAKPTKETGPRAQPQPIAFPATLGKVLRMSVTRPRVSRSRKEKEEEDEVLIIEGVRLANYTTYVKFDVFVDESGQVNGDEESATWECAGSFVHVPHTRRPLGNGSMTTVARFGIGELLEEIGADGDRTIVVTLMPKCAGDTVTVGGVKIDYYK